MRLRLRIPVALAVVVSLLVSAVGASAYHAAEQEYHPIEREDFQQVWERTDRPVLELVEARTWIWGPGAFSHLISERYDDADDGEREVQYFDKSRMEETWNGSAADPDGVDSPWSITQGLLARELMTGRMQLGDDTFRHFHPSMRSAAGDPLDTTAPTYAAMGNLMDRAPRQGGNVIVEHANRAGVVTTQAERFENYGVRDVASGEWQDVEGIEHNIADVFWDFMQTDDATIYENGAYLEGQKLFLNPFYAVGYPLGDAFWADVRVGGQTRDVLIQAFERRVLTYTPGNPVGWEVESGNVGQHYYDWRYNVIGEPLPVATIQLDPIDAQNLVGTEYTLTATLHHDGLPVNIENLDHVAVSIDRVFSNDGNGGVNPTVALDNGNVTVSYTGPNDPAVDTITINIEYAGEMITASTTKSWQAFEDFYECDAVVVDGESIQSAINSSEDGDTICVMEGTYTGALNITGSNSLTILGEGSDLVTIDASGASGYGIDGSFSDTARGSNVALIGFTHYGPREGIEAQNYGLKMLNIDGLWIEDVHVYESRRTGIDVFQATNVTMLNVESHDNDANGIAIRDSSAVSVNNASTSGNGWGGFALYAPGTEAIHDVEIVNSSFADEGAGVYLQHSNHTNIRILDSTFTGNTVGLGFGTDANEAPEVDVLRNVFTGNTVAIGVDATVDVNNVVINNNSIAGNDDGVINNGAATLDATANWWGNADGPSGEGPGTGDSVSTSVDFSDWLTSDPF